MLTGSHDACCHLQLAERLKGSLGERAHYFCHPHPMLAVNGGKVAGSPKHFLRSYVQS